MQEKTRKAIEVLEGMLSELTADDYLNEQESDALSYAIARLASSKSIPDRDEVVDGLRPCPFCGEKGLKSFTCGPAIPDCPRCEDIFGCNGCDIWLDTAEAWNRCSLPNPWAEIKSESDLPKCEREYDVTMVGGDIETASRVPDSAVDTEWWMDSYIAWRERPAPFVKE